MFEFAMNVPRPSMNAIKEYAQNKLRLWRAEIAESTGEDSTEEMDQEDIYNSEWENIWKAVTGMPSILGVVLAMLLSPAAMFLKSVLLILSMIVGYFLHSLGRLLQENRRNQNPVIGRGTVTKIRVYCLGFLALMVILSLSPTTGMPAILGVLKIVLLILSMIVELIVLKGYFFHSSRRLRRCSLIRRSSMNAIDENFMASSTTESTVTKIRVYCLGFLANVPRPSMNAIKEFAMNAQNKLRPWTAKIAKFFEIAELTFEDSTEEKDIYNSAWDYIWKAVTGMPPILAVVLAMLLTPVAMFLKIVLLILSMIVELIVLKGYFFHSLGRLLQLNDRRNQNPVIGRGTVYCLGFLALMVILVANAIFLNIILHVY